MARALLKGGARIACLSGSQWSLYDVSHNPRSWVPRQDMRLASVPKEPLVLECACVSGLSSLRTLFHTPPGRDSAVMTCFTQDDRDDVELETRP